MHTYPLFLYPARLESSLRKSLLVHLILAGVMADLWYRMPVLSVTHDEITVALLAPKEHALKPLVSKTTLRSPVGASSFSDLLKAARSAVPAVSLRLSSNKDALSVLRRSKKAPVFGMEKATQARSNEVARLMHDAQHSTVERTNFKWSDYESVLAKQDLPKDSLPLILSAIQAKQTAFRDCYEKALFQDSSVSANVDMQVSSETPGQNSLALAKINRAKGSSIVLNQLRSCLESVGKEIKLPVQASNKEVHFSLFFKS